MDLLSLEHFSGCLNETFSADLQGMQAAFVLVETQPLPVRGPDALRAPFSLVFHNASALLFPPADLPDAPPAAGQHRDLPGAGSAGQNGLPLPGRLQLTDLQNAWETNPSRAGRAGAVIAHQVGGQAARSLLPASLQMDAVGFVASLEEVLPGAMQAVSRDRRGRILATSQNWSADPNSRGAFPRPQPGYFTRIAHAEAGAVDNLLFAGDHTSSFYEWQGFMEGAVLSGLRAASEAGTLFRSG